MKVYEVPGLQQS